MPSMPFKLNQDRRQHIPRQKRKVTNWREYDAGLRQRGSLTVWFTDEAVQAWQAEPRATRGGQPDSPDGVDLASRLPPAVPADRRADRLRHRPARAGPRRPRSHHPMPPGRDAGDAAATTAQRRRTRAPAGGQHGPEAVWRG